MFTYEVGNASEAIVLTAYINAGFAVSLPFGSGCAYDLVVDTGKQLLRIQVKTGWRRKGCLIYKGKRRIKDSQHNAMRRYREDEVDFFAVYYASTNSIYVVPSKLQGADGNLRLDPVLNGQQKLVRWAQEFTWEKHIDALRSESSCALAHAK